MLVGNLVPEALDAVSLKSRPTYATGMRLIGSELGNRELADVTLPDLIRLRNLTQTRVGQRKVERARATGRSLRAYDADAHGKGAAENFVRAARFFFNYAKGRRLISDSPASQLMAPRRPQAPERALTESELAQIWHVATTTGRDPALDRHLLLFLRHTGARREGCLNLALDHLNAQRRAVTLTEKNGETRELPLQMAVLEDLQQFAISRGARRSGDPVFRYASGAPITRRHFNSLFDRVDRHLDWTEALDVATHWIRHTTLSDIAAVSDVRVAAAYAGHSPGSLGVIGHYAKVGFDDLRTAYESLFGSDD